MQFSAGAGASEPSSPSRTPKDEVDLSVDDFDSECSLQLNMSNANEAQTTPSSTGKVVSEEASNMVTRAEFEMLMKQINETDERLGNKINETDKRLGKKIVDGDEGLKKRIRTLEAQGRIYTSLVAVLGGIGTVLSGFLTWQSLIKSPEEHKTELGLSIAGAALTSVPSALVAARTYMVKGDADEETKDGCSPDVEMGSGVTSPTEGASSRPIRHLTSTHSFHQPSSPRL